MGLEFENLTGLGTLNTGSLQTIPESQLINGILPFLGASMR